MPFLVGMSWEVRGESDGLFVVYAGLRDCDGGFLWISNLDNGLTGAGAAAAGAAGGGVAESGAELGANETLLGMPLDLSPRGFVASGS